MRIGVYRILEPDRLRTVRPEMTPALRTTFLVCACCASVAACYISDDRESAAETSGEEQSGLLTSLHEMQGFWLIRRFDDFEPSWRNGTPWRNASLQIDEDRITYNVGCNQSGNLVSIGSDGILHDSGDGSLIIARWYKSGQLLRKRFVWTNLQAPPFLVP